MKLRFNGQHVFRVGQRLILGTKPKTKNEKEDNKVNANAVKLINTLARGINARAKEDEDQERQLAQLHPDPPPACILAPTKTQQEVDAWYSKPETIKTNVNGIRGLESYQPPLVLLAEVTAEEKARINL